MKSLTIEQQTVVSGNLPSSISFGYKSMESQKEEMLRMLDVMTEGQRHQQPSPSEWSPIQVLEHVVAVEEMLAEPFYAVLPTDRNVLLKARLFATFAGGFMRFCAKSGKRAPSMPVFEPQGNFDFATIKQRWDVAREQLAAKLSLVTPDNSHLPIALHPIAGPLDAKRVIDLLDVHLAYHLRHLPSGTSA